MTIHNRELYISSFVVAKLPFSIKERSNTITFMAKSQKNLKEICNLVVVFLPNIFNDTVIDPVKLNNQINNLGNLNETLYKVIKETVSC